MDKNNVRLLYGKDIAHARQDSRCHIIEILSLTHDIQIVVRLYTEYFKHTVKHLAVLSGHCDNYIQAIGILLQLSYDRCHLYGLGTCAEDQHNLFLIHHKSEFLEQQPPGESDSHPVTFDT